MHTQKFSHMVGGKILEVIMVISAIALLVLFLMFLFADALDVMPMLILLVSVISVIWFTCKYYKPAFTNVIFSDEGIISKTHFEQDDIAQPHSKR